MKKVRIAVIGGGVAGMSAAVYALRANAEVTLFEQYAVGGLAATIDRIENYPALAEVSGAELTDNLYRQVKALGARFAYEQVVDVKTENGAFRVVTAKSEDVFDAVIVATGTKHNKLGFEEKYVGKGVSYCATCDGNFFRAQPVVVAGGGNAAVKDALYLSSLCQKVYVVCPAAQLSSDAVNVSLLQNADNVEILYDCAVTGISGEDAVESVEVTSAEGKGRKIAAKALFVAVGSKPSTEFLRSLPLTFVNGFLRTDDKMMTDVAGLFAAGDCANGVLKQIVTACGDGAKAGSFAVAFAKRKAAQQET